MSVVITELQVSFELALQNSVAVILQTPVITPAAAGYAPWDWKQAATVALHAGSDLLKSIDAKMFDGGWYYQDAEDYLVENQLAHGRVVVIAKLIGGHTQRAQLGIDIPKYTDAEGRERASQLLAAALRRVTDSLAGGGYAFPDSPDEEQHTDDSN